MRQRRQIWIIGLWQSARLSVHREFPPHHSESLCRGEATQTALNCAVGGYAQTHNRQLQMLPLLLLQCSRWFLAAAAPTAPTLLDVTVTQDYEWYTRESAFNSHSPTHHLHGCAAAIPSAVDSFCPSHTMWPARQWGGLKRVLLLWLMIVTGLQLGARIDK